MTPDETLKQLMDAIQVKCGDGYLDALLGLFSLHEEGKGMPHGLPYTAAPELLDACQRSARRISPKCTTEYAVAKITEIITTEQGEEA